jgi:hypothetical protein
MASPLGAIGEDLMSAASERPNFEIVPPIILNEDADIQAYPSAEAVIRHVEVIDILNNEYTFHDSTGRVLEARVHKGEISLVPTSKVEPDSETLRNYMLGALRLRGTPETSLSNAPFSQLVRLLAEKSNR